MCTSRSYRANVLTNKNILHFNNNIINVQVFFNDFLLQNNTHILWGFVKTTVSKEKQNLITISTNICESLGFYCLSANGGSSQAAQLHRMKLTFCHFPMGYPGSGVVVDCIESRSLPPFLLPLTCFHFELTDLNT